MGVYDLQIKQAQRVIKAKGQLVTWVPQDVSVPDVTKPWKTAQDVAIDGDDVTYQVSIVFIPIGSGISPMQALSHLLHGTSVADGAPTGLMGAVPFSPRLNDTVLRGTETLTVKSIDVLAPNGDPILYTIEFA